MIAVPCPVDHRYRKAFTMIELLVVIAIIGVLSTIVVGISRSAAQTSKRKKAQVQIEAISSALESYKAKYGDYPRPVGGTMNPEDMSKMLYQAVSGDGQNHIDGGNGTASTGRPGEDGEIFIESAHVGAKGSSFVDGDGYFLKDPWGNPYHYVKGDENSETQNPTTFDLWTEGEDETGEDEDLWITNWN